VISMTPIMMKLDHTILRPETVVPSYGRQRRTRHGSGRGVEVPVVIVHSSNYDDGSANVNRTRHAVRLTNNPGLLMLQSYLPVRYRQISK